MYVAQVMRLDYYIEVIGRGEGFNLQVAESDNVHVRRLESLSTPWTV